MSLIAGNLNVVQRALDTAEIAWGVYAGSAAWVYGYRRPINNVDIVVSSGSLQPISRLLQEGNRTVQYDGNRLLWRGINIYDDISIRQGGKLYSFALEQTMIAKLRRLPLLGSRVMVLSPEDVVAHKLILSCGIDKPQQHFTDAEGIVKRQQIDAAYLRERLRSAGAGPEIVDRLSELGIEG